MEIIVSLAVLTALFITVRLGARAYPRELGALPRSDAEMLEFLRKAELEREKRGLRLRPYFPRRMYAELNRMLSAACTAGTLEDIPRPMREAVENSRFLLMGLDAALSSLSSLAPLPSISGTVRAMVFAICYLSKTENRVETSELHGAVIMAESVFPLSEEELFALPLLLEGQLYRALISALKKPSHNGDTEFAENCAEVSRIIASLRGLRQLNRQSFIERASKTEKLLCEDDIYAKMDIKSRAYYREQCGILARRCGKSETEAAERALTLSKEAEKLGHSEEKTHIGYYLIGKGRKTLCKSAGKISIKGRLAFAAAERSAGLYRLTLAVLFLLVLGFGLFTLSYDFYTAFLLAFSSYFMIKALLIALLSRLLPPAFLPRLSESEIPEDERLLIATPVLLTDEHTAISAVRRLAMHCHANPDERFSYILLGDFKDAQHPVEAGDELIVKAATDAIAALSGEFGKRFFYLQRSRVYIKSEKAYTMREKKRGALESLNSLILGLPCPDEYAAATFEPAELTGMYKYVLTCDADTVLPAGSAAELLATILHPMNAKRAASGGKRGYSVIAPRMETDIRTLKTPFGLMMGGRGGMDSYQKSAFDAPSGLLHLSSFMGKGIYDVRAFHAASSPYISPERVLSHDLLEGELSGCGLASDIVLLDSHPQYLRAYLKRLHRWIRGDWQLLPYILPFKRFGAKGEKNPLGSSSKHKIFQNILLSLYPQAFLAILIWSSFTGDAILLQILLAIWFLPSLVPFDRIAFCSAAVRFALLPIETASGYDAIVRAVWRMVFSRKFLLEWTTSAQEENKSPNFKLKEGWPQLLIAILCSLCALTNEAVFIPGLMLSAIFIIMPFFVPTLEKPFTEKSEPSREEKRLLMDTAAETLDYYEKSVTKEDNYLPPDNVQLSPEKGAAHRTSPSNIGFYITALISAKQLGLLEASEALLRLERAADSMDRLKRERGHFYNWYDTISLSPLEPIYISSVDSGNLCACLMCAAQALRTWLPESPKRCAELSSRFDGFAREMDFDFLYDSSADLFYIGALSGQRPEGAHYDLLMSEARLLSFTATALRQIPRSHFSRLQRTPAWNAPRGAIMSYSGTMFEYLMPHLLLPLYRFTLLFDACAAAVAVQKSSELFGIYGISESGYYKFDDNMNYQYKAFGVKALAEDGKCESGVIAPYAGMLSLSLEPRGALENLRRMRAMGLSDEYGLYEAADFYKPRIGLELPYRPVFSHMAHHQGMILTAIANFLCKESPMTMFSHIPVINAFETLLCEGSPISMPRRRSRLPKVPPSLSKKTKAEYTVLRGSRLVPARAMYAEGRRLIAFADSSVKYYYENITVFRSSMDAASKRAGLALHIRDEESGESAAVFESTENAVFFPGGLRLTFSALSISLTLVYCLEPLSGALFLDCSMKDLSQKPRAVSLRLYFEPVLMPEDGYEAHPSFADLFISARRKSETEMSFYRRSREKSGFDASLNVSCAAAGAKVFMTADRRDALGECSSASSPYSLSLPADKIGSRFGDVVMPCGLITALFSGESAQNSILFRFDVSRGERETPAAGRGDYEKALVLSEAHEEAFMQRGDMRPYEDGLLFRSIGAMETMFLKRRSAAPLAEKRSKLWEYSLSGDSPLIFVEADEKTDVLRLTNLLKCLTAYRMPFETLFTGDVAALRERLSEVGIFENTEGAQKTAIAPPPDENARALLIRLSRIHINNENPSLESAVSALQTPMERREESEIFTGGRMDESGSELLGISGHGGFEPSGAFRLILKDGVLPPMPWAQVISSPEAGTLINSCGASFSYFRNSHHMRITPMPQSELSPECGERLEITADSKLLLPYPTAKKHSDFEILFSAGEAVFLSRQGGLEIKYIVFTDLREAALIRLLEMRNISRKTITAEISFSAFLILGERIRDGETVTLYKNSDGQITAETPLCDMRVSIFSEPRMKAAADEYLPLARLKRAFSLQPGEGATQTIAYIATDKRSRLDEIEIWSGFSNLNVFGRMDEAKEKWAETLSAISIATPVRQLDLLINHFIPYQAIASRLYAKAGMSQAGGATGFRDQLQDALSVMMTKPEIARRQLLICAAHQFTEGDVMHWFHEDFVGIRTRITDDRLFLPYVLSQYVHITGDKLILQERIPYITMPPLESGEKDRYAKAQVSEIKESMMKHCVRAIDSIQLSERGLAMMLGGDWNDGMDEVGGESVWLSMFLALTLSEFLPLCPQSEKSRLYPLAESLKQAIEDFCWDGDRYMRAFYTGGEAIGAKSSAACRIDLISQAFSSLISLKQGRVSTALASAWNELYDERTGIMKLLSPPFDESARRAGYIASYPAGIRENGGQYTHGAIWYLWALCKEGLVEKAWLLALSLLPATHAETTEKADIYMREPYVISADIYTNADNYGRGGWTWYTGSAGWLFTVVTRELLGLVKRCDMLCLRALLPDNFDTASVIYRYNSTLYTLICDRSTAFAELDGKPLTDGRIHLKDDGGAHTARFPPRQSRK
ncbi:MAG: glucoamylase family protein [Eubacteriales bacterium]|nr:glucoamylase family protein [Eubacteriales bacterium]